MSTSCGSFGSKCRQAGFSLIEVAVFIAVVGVGISGVILAITTATRDSVDPLIRKQSVAIAESLLEEIESMPFTFCDPDDPNAATATGPADCTGGAGGPNDEARLPLGPEAGETRYSGVTPFDNVSDYNGYNTALEAPPGIKDITGAPIAGLDVYNAAVTITQTALGVVPAADSLQISVTVTGPANTVVTVEGYRTQYAPNAVP
ncbi:MAG: prepilin-type N-terminal cleavage/methylation domain-containing protein [Betaproteobacteria bacterium]|nr:prepilin-type N-terminal cleavage/methylation domain-containing protein [Betaproteobacteria bacterium]